jgi:hypothetical protein
MSILCNRVAQLLPIALASTPPSESGDSRPADLVEGRAGMHGPTSGSMTRTVCFS